MGQSYPTGIKSIQRGTAIVNQTSTTAITVSSVNTSKAKLSFLGQSSTGTTMAGSIYLTLLNSTTINATMLSTGGTFSGTVSWQLTEFY